MDGFYVAKFKVEKRTSTASTSATASASSSKTKANGSSASTFAAANAADDVDMDMDMDMGVDSNHASRAMKLSDKGELVPDKEARKAAKEGKFDDAADEEIMKSESTSTCCGCEHTGLLNGLDSKTKRGPRLSQVGGALDCSRIGSEEMCIGHKLTRQTGWHSPKKPRARASRRARAGQWKRCVRSRPRPRASPRRRKHRTNPLPVHRFTPRREPLSSCLSKHTSSARALMFVCI